MRYPYSLQTRIRWSGTMLHVPTPRYLSSTMSVPETSTYPTISTIQAHEGLMPRVLQRYLAEMLDADALPPGTEQIADLAIVRAPLNVRPPKARAYLMLVTKRTPMTHR